MVTGRLITIDGAGGVGKSTTVTSTVKHLGSTGLPTYATSQPSRTVLGDHIREYTDTYTGIALACLVAGDRHHQQRVEIVPALADEKIVVCDRYLPSSLVLQVLDGVPAERVWQLNAGIRVPEVAVVLRAAPEVIADRLAARGAHNRFERRPDYSIRRELELFDQVAEDLRTRGWPVHVIDCTEHARNETALAIAQLVGPAAGPSR